MKENTQYPCKYRHTISHQTYLDIQSCQLSTQPNRPADIHTDERTGHMTSILNRQLPTRKGATTIMELWRREFLEQTYYTKKRKKQPTTINDHHRWLWSLSRHDSQNPRWFLYGRAYTNRNLYLSHPNMVRQNYSSHYNTTYHRTN